MKALALLAVYTLFAALVLPGSILAQDEAAPETETGPAEPEAQAQPPAQVPAPAEPAPEQPAPAPEQPAPEPEPQFLADESAEAPDPQPKAVAAASGSVTIADFTFSPATITINQGDTVTWNNNGPTPHSATANDGSFDTGILRKGQSGSHTFDAAGTYSYICTPHPYMKGTVVVQAAQTGGGGTDDSGSAAADTGSTAGETSQSDDGPTLPSSGADSGALLVLGGLMLVLGIAVHRRTTTG
jgi:amicyanin